MIKLTRIPYKDKYGIDRILILPHRVSETFYGVDEVQALIERNKKQEDIQVIKLSVYNTVYLDVGRVCTQEELDSVTVKTIRDDITRKRDEAYRWWETVHHDGEFLEKQLVELTPALG